MVAPVSVPVVAPVSVPVAAPVSVPVVAPVSVPVEVLGAGVVEPLSVVAPPQAVNEATRAKLAAARAIVWNFTVINFVLLLLYCTQ